LNLIEAPQDTNSIRMLSIKNKSKNDPIKKQSIDSNKTSLLRNILNLTETPQDTNSIRILPAKNES